MCLRDDLFVSHLLCICVGVRGWGKCFPSCFGRVRWNFRSGPVDGFASMFLFAVRGGVVQRFCFVRFAGFVCRDVIFGFGVFRLGGLRSSPACAEASSISLGAILLVKPTLASGHVSISHWSFMGGGAVGCFMVSRVAAVTRGTAALAIEFFASPVVCLLLLGHQKPLAAKFCAPKVSVALRVLFVWPTSVCSVPCLRHSAASMRFGARSLFRFRRRDVLTLSQITFGLGGREPPCNLQPFDRLRGST